MIKSTMISMAFLLGLGMCVSGQSPADCAALMKFGVYDKFKTFTTETQYKQIKEFFENDSFSSRQQAEAKAGQLGLDIVGILGLNFGGSTSTANFEVWQQRMISSTYQEALSLGLSTTSIETISGKLTSLIEACINQRGVHAFVIPSADPQIFTVTTNFIPMNATHPETEGTLTITPAQVAAQCAPTGILGVKHKFGPGGLSLSCRRLPTDTVVILLNTEDGSPTFTYDAYTPPKPTVDFRATKSTIDSGDSTRLIWDVKNSLRVSLDGLGLVAESGTRDVAPSTTTEYKLLVTSLSSQVSTYSQTITVTPPPPVFAGARVEWYTTDDNKDHDSTVSVHITCGGTVVASVSGQWGEFRDNTASGWKELTVIERPKKSAMIGVCTTRTREDPNGDDEWHFNWALELRFSDGSKKSYTWNGENLDSDRRETGVKGL